MTVRGFFQSCLLVVGVLSFAGCKEPVAVTETPVQVEAGPPVVHDVPLELRYPIELEADEEVSITPVAVSGFLLRVVVDVGDEVTVGQLIALVDCREYAAQRAQAETAIAKWEAQLDEADSQLERLQRMGDKLVAPAEIERARAEARVAEAELADARAKLSEAGQRQGYCSLRAPFSGFVSNRYLDPGAMVRPGGTPVVSIVKTREVRVVASVTEEDAPQIMVGAEVDLEFHAFPDTTFHAQVARKGRSLDEATRTLRVEMELPNTTDALLPGMTGHASIAIGTREGAMLVPATAVLRLEETAFAFVVRDGDKKRAERVAVELGEDLGDWVEVRSGIEPGDVVITTGRELVDDGTWVEVNPPRRTFETEGEREAGAADDESDPEEDSADAVEDAGEPTDEPSSESSGDAGSETESDQDDTDAEKPDEASVKAATKKNRAGKSRKPRAPKKSRSKPETPPEKNGAKASEEPEALPVKPAPLPPPGESKESASASRDRPSDPAEGPT